jgi:predicted component of type VI protein secretion system
LPRSDISEYDAEQLVAEARERAKGQEGLAHLVIAVENAASLKLALRLSNSPAVAISIVAAQPIRGLALAAGLSVADAVHLESRAHACWICSAGSLEQTLNRWPPLKRPV